MRKEDRDSNIVMNLKTACNMKKSSTNLKQQNLLTQLKLTFPAETLRSGIHAIAVRQDSNMTRVYSVIQPKKEEWS